MSSTVSTPWSLIRPGAGTSLRFSTSTVCPEVQFSMQLHEIEAAQALQSLVVGSPTQLTTQQMMAELSVDNEIQFREASSVGVAPSTRPGVDPNETIMPMARLNDEWRSSTSACTTSYWELPVCQTSWCTAKSHLHISIWAHTTTQSLDSI